MLFSPSVSFADGSLVRGSHVLCKSAHIHKNRTVADEYIATALFCITIFKNLVLLFLVLALLVCNTAAGLAGRLAGSLALAAATLLCALTHVTGIKGLDSFHDSLSPIVVFSLHGVMSTKISIPPLLSRKLYHRHNIKSRNSDI